MNSLLIIDQNLNIPGSYQLTLRADNNKYQRNHDYREKYYA